MSDVSRKVVPDKGESEQRKTRVTKVLKVYLAQESFFSAELERRVRDGVYTKTDTMTGMVAGDHKKRKKERQQNKKRKTKVDILKIILSLGGSWSVKYLQWSNMLMSALAKNTLWFNFL